MENNCYVFDYTKDYKSTFVVGNITMFCTKRFNWFQRKMLKVFFGFEVNNLESEK